MNFEFMQLDSHDNNIKTILKLYQAVQKILYVTEAQYLVEYFMTVRDLNL